MMNQLRKWMGLIWMLLAPLSMFYLIKTALHQIALHPVTDTKIQWGVFVIVFIPIAIGLCIFGWYAWKEEYKRQM
ncbi:DUF6814 family protein [Agriterribacter sp.]|uniref:DUF6814 family protein n=1 Tax=Agriterribacter sp. TaxID=2821509 RepID=UPI002C3D2F2A|nr:hypothetical protein [Agriterribacter sp.]HTN07119.1 hypothetical protein [Agriterribacter sp.]